MRSGGSATAFEDHSATTGGHQAGGDGSSSKSTSETFPEHEHVTKNPAGFKQTGSLGVQIFVRAQRARGTVSRVSERI